MNGLWIGISLLALLALGFLFFPFVQASRRAAAVVPEVEDRKQQNIDIYKDRLAELERERESGTLDDVAFSQLKLELEKNLLGDVVEQEKRTAPIVVGNRQLVTVTLLALITVTAAMGIYSKLGAYAELEIAEQRAEMRKGGRTPTLEEAITSLQNELDVQPNNPEGWYMLATTFLNMGRFQEGAEALQQVLSTLPEDAPQYVGVMGQYAQARYFAEGNQITPSLRAHIDKTLLREPGEVTTLGLLGIDAFENQQYQQALSYWNKALENVDDNSERSRSLRTGITKAREALQAQGITVADQPEVLSGAQLEVEVTLSEELKSRVQPEQVIFVFARPVGGRMPLAAVKLTVKDLPARVTLDDSLAMMPEMKLSSVEVVELNAKVSLSGRPQATPGDLIGTLAPVKVKAENGTLKLVINQVVQ